MRDSLRSAIANADTGGSAALRERLERLQKIDHLYEKMEQDIAGVGVLFTISYSYKRRDVGALRGESQGFLCRLRLL